MFVLGFACGLVFALSSLFGIWVYATRPDPGGPFNWPLD
jgi:hypothetical protein